MSVNLLVGGKRSDKKLNPKFAGQDLDTLSRTGSMSSEEQPFQLNNPKISTIECYVADCFQN